MRVKPVSVTLLFVGLVVACGSALAEEKKDEGAKNEAQVGGTGAAAGGGAGAAASFYAVKGVIFITPTIVSD